MRKVGDLFEFASIHTENFYRDNHYIFASGNYCHEIISESVYQSNDTDNDASL